MNSENINEKLNNVNTGSDGQEEHPEWMTCLVGKLSFCPKCEQETLLSDGIKTVCTNCGYQK